MLGAEAAGRFAQAFKPGLSAVTVPLRIPSFFLQQTGSTVEPVKKGSSVLLQHGGIATRATRGVFGETGPEAIIPLNDQGATFLIEALRDAIGPGGDTATFNGAGPTTIVVKLGDEEIGRKLVPILRRGLIEVDMENAGLGFGR